MSIMSGQSSLCITTGVQYACPMLTGPPCSSNQQVSKYIRQHGPLTFSGPYPSSN